MVSEKTILAIVQDATSNFSGEDLATAIAAKINHVEDIKRLRRCCEKEMADAKIAYEKKYADAKNKLHELTKSCPHLELTYYPDPSGNNDSYHQCEICGAERKKFK